MGSGIETEIIREKYKNTPTRDRRETMSCKERSGEAQLETSGERKMEYMFLL